MGTSGVARWAELFETADIPFARAQWTHEALDDPQIAHNRMFVRLNDPELGDVEQMGVPVVFTETPGEVRWPRAGPGESASRTRRADRARRSSS